MYIKRDYFNKISVPVMYTPGDNEWTDCHRVSNGQFNPLERLYKLRSLFFSIHSGASGGKRKLAVTSQGTQSPFEKYVENAIWQEEAVVFGTIHIVGSLNDRIPWLGLEDGDRTDDRVDEYTDRDEAAIKWIETIFTRAMTTGAEGVVIFTHANMWGPYELSLGIPLFAFDRVVQTLNRWSAKFDKPVWLINGDSHDFSIIKPFTPGSTHPLSSRFGAAKPLNVYRIHGEEYDAPKFTAITLETYTESDVGVPGYDPNVVMEWFELKVRPGLGDDIFAYNRVKLKKN